MWQRDLAGGLHGQLARALMVAAARVMRPRQMSVIRRLPAVIREAGAAWMVGSAGAARSARSCDPVARPPTLDALAAGGRDRSLMRIVARTGIDPPCGWGRLDDSCQQIRAAVVRALRPNAPGVKASELDFRKSCSLPVCAYRTRRTSAGLPSLIPASGSSPVDNESQWGFLNIGSGETEGFAQAPATGSFSVTNSRSGHCWFGEGSVLEYGATGSGGSVTLGHLAIESLSSPAGAVAFLSGTASRCIPRPSKCFRRARVAEQPPDLTFEFKRAAAVARDQAVPLVPVFRRKLRVSPVRTVCAQTACVESAWNPAGAGGSLSPGAEGGATARRSHVFPLPGRGEITVSL